MRSWLFLLLLSCSTTETFKLRVEGASLYRNCLDIYRDKKLCRNETARWCLDQGLEADCFVDYTRLPPSQRFR